MKHTFRYIDLDKSIESLSIRKWVFKITKYLGFNLCI